MPALRVGAFIDVKQSIRQEIASALDNPVSGKPIQVEVEANGRFY
jgi:hypothetical protein